MKLTPLSLLFSGKLFLASMVAFVIADRIGLPKPYWCIVTCCVVMNPLTGAVRSKAVYRFTGTACGGIIALVLAAVFASVPVLLVIGAGIVATAAFVCSILDRTPRGYGYGLLGITLMLVAVPGASHAESMFDTAVARVSEIGLGIIVATIVDSVIVPRSLGPTLRRRLHGWLTDIETLMNDAFSGRSDHVVSEHGRLKIIADITALSTLTGQLRYDPMVPRRDVQLALAIQQRLLRLVPTLSAITSRLAVSSAAELAIVRPLLEEARQQLGEDTSGHVELVERMRHLPLATDGDAIWSGVMRGALADLMADTLRLWSEVRRLDAALDGREMLEPDLERKVRQAVPFPLAPDWSLALRIAGGILVAYAVLCGFWWATGWQYGAGAVLLGTVALAFFGSGDDPRPIIAKFGLFTTLAFAAVGILSYGLLPLAQDYPTFVIAMGLFMLPLGIWAASNPMALLLLALGLSSINLQGAYSPMDFGAYLESMFADLFGIYAAFALCSLFRTLGPAHTVARLARQEQDDVIRLSRRASNYDRDAYINRALDRIAAITLRFGADTDARQSARLLNRLRIGASVARLRLVALSLSGEARIAAEDLLAEIRRQIRRDEPTPTLLALIDRTLTAVHRQAPHPDQHVVLRSLASLRIGFFGPATAWASNP